MDPNTALENMREMVAATLANADEDTSEWLVEMCESFDALDGWLSRGGFLPSAWANGR